MGFSLGDLEALNPQKWGEGGPVAYVPPVGRFGAGCQRYSLYRWFLAICVQNHGNNDKFLTKNAHSRVPDHALGFNSGSFASH